MPKRSIEDGGSQVFVKSFKSKEEKERPVHVNERLDGETQGEEGTPWGRKRLFTESVAARETWPRRVEGTRASQRPRTKH